MKELNLLTAQEAKTISETSYCQLNRIAKEISEAAKENRDRILWCIYDTDIKATEKIITELTDKGYKITQHYDERDQSRPSDLMISW